VGAYAEVVTGNSCPQASYLLSDLYGETKVYPNAILFLGFAISITK
jgi:hypothetical protein